MKKILLIVAVVLCVAVAGTAFAITRNQADPVNGTLAADTMFVLSLDSCSTANIALTAGTPTEYTIQCDITKSNSANYNGTLTVTLADSAPKDLDDVTITLYSDAQHEHEVANATCTGAGSFTVTGISASTPYYALITLANNLSESDTQNVGGTMTLAFAKA